MKQITLALGLSFLLSAMALPTFSQVSNDNEDGVYKIDEQTRALDFEPGQVLVKFKDESTIKVHKNERGKFRAASISAVDRILQEYGVDEMEKLFPNEVAKPKAQLRKKKAPNGTIVQEKNLDKVFWVKTKVQSPDSTLQLIKELKGMPEIEYAEPNYRVYITADVPKDYSIVPKRQPKDIRLAPVHTETYATIICAHPENNPLYSQQYGITQQNIHTLWDKPIINKKRPVIAILDTGVDITHPDLQDNIWQNTKEVEGEAAYDDDGNGVVDDKYGWNFVENYYELTDRNGHGTHVAGIAAAADNEVGIVGANPLALIMPLKVLGDRGVGDIATCCRGVLYAAENGADIINMSFGHSSGISQTEIDAITNAYQTSILIASAGNNSASVYDIEHGPLWPAAYYLVLGVQASGSNGQLVHWSNYDPDGPIFSEDGIDGRNHEIMMPGEDIYSSYPNGNYKKLSGTSMSAPLFAGAVSALNMVKEYPSKDYLYADLIHLKADFEKIYSDETPRTSDLEIVSVTIDDNVEGNTNKDGSIDAGETVRLIAVLRNTWSDASDIRLKLIVDSVYADYVEIENTELNCEYGLSAYGQIELPIYVHFSNNIGDNTRIKITFQIFCQDPEFKYSRDIYVTINNMIKINGLISEDMTLTSDHVYFVNDNVAILEGATWTIEPGTRLEFAEGKYLSVFGSLKAMGTPEKPIEFVGHRGAKWLGVRDEHFSTATIIEEGQYPNLYTNADSTLFTLKQTSDTPFLIVFPITVEGYHKSEFSPRVFYFDRYMNPSNDFTYTATDPSYLSGAVVTLLKDMKDYVLMNSSCTKTEEFCEFGEIAIAYMDFGWAIFGNKSIMSFCAFDNINVGGITMPYMEDCRLNAEGFNGILYGKKNTFTGRVFDMNPIVSFSNVVNFPVLTRSLYSELRHLNFINNYIKDNFPIGIDVKSPIIDHSFTPSYLGTGREDIIRPFIYEMGNGSDGFGTIDLSNMPSRPYAEAHGIVWKVVVNGKDAQDEFEDLAPLGVGKHKFEVYFNRPMNINVAPRISFGVREPYTQHTVAEDGSWSADSLIYTAYVTISGKTKSDGLNRIYVDGAEDNEFFPCPYEKTRFNINIQAAGSMATGFMAEAGLGKVDLTWNNENNDFEDAMGFNVYRYTMVNDSTTSDTIRLNREIVDIETTEYTDYDVTPGTTYYYLYKVLSTDLQEYDMSNVVAATPMTSTLGDANGSGDVDVADVITTVNYAAGQQPKPFIFEAADMNTDLSIDILDVIGIIKKIINPDTNVTSMAMATATYTIEDGTLYVESPVALAGVQVQIAMNNVQWTMDNNGIRVADDLNGFEHTSAWLSDDDYLFLAYNMNGKTLTPGKHALLHIGNGKIGSIRLSDINGHNVEAFGDEATRVNRMATDMMIVKGIYDLQGRKLTGDSSQEIQLPKGVYIVNGKKVVR